ncbi:hypothetical protein L596_004847 [Steinernema carpocapsae]|uniref:Uncharacterized protein n=1 Tax=Steinernema carpocapsae TaxID=34508 RepID=A0A4V6I894_STECR|nr:hypothetical protein L596_004847 [Steinernema carpocapsae]
MKGLRARKLDRSHAEAPPMRMDYGQEHDLPPPVYSADRNQQPSAFEADQFEQEYGVDKGNVNKSAIKPKAHSQFLGGMKSVWMTKHTEDTKNDRRLYVVTTIRELIVYVFFLIIICVIAFSMTSSSQYYFTKVVGDLFLANAPPDQKKFTEVQTIDEVWEYMENQLMIALYWNETTMLTNYSDRSMIFYENRLLGYPRIRTIRVSNSSCEVVSSFKREIKECFGHYEEAKEEQLTDSDNNETAFTYQPASVLQSNWVWGQIATYGGGGYVQDLSINNRSDSARLIANLKANRWISRGTRVIFIDFSVYNANLNLFCIVQLIIELPATGGVITMSNLNTMKLLRYVTTRDYVILGCEGIFCAFVIYYLVEEIIEIFKWRCSYLTSFWNLMDLVVLATSGTAIYLSIYRTLLVRRKVETLLNGVTQYENLQSVVYAENRFTDSVAVLLFFSWIKLFKYVSFNKTMSQLNATLSRAAKDISGFGIMFGVMFFAYVQAGYMAFGSQVDFESDSKEYPAPFRSSSTRQSTRQASRFSARF